MRRCARVADRNSIALTAGRETMGRHRLSAEQEAAIIEARYENTDAPQREIAERAGAAGRAWAAACITLRAVKSCYG
jgi:hypothetical protein